MRCLESWVENKKKDARRPSLYSAGGGSNRGIREIEAHWPCASHSTNSTFQVPNNEKEMLGFPKSQIFESPLV